MKKIICSFLLLCALGILTGCSLFMADPASFGNRRAMASTLKRPTPGLPEERGYLNPKYRDWEEASANVAVLPPEVVSSRPVSASDKVFLAKLKDNSLEEQKLAVASSGLFKELTDESGADFVLSSQMFVHIATAGGKLVSDPVSGEPMSRVYAIFTLVDKKNGETAAKHTGMVQSDWQEEDQAKANIERNLPEMSVELAALLELLK